MQAIAAKLGVTATFAETEWDGIFAGLDSGRYDIAANGVEVTEERENGLPKFTAKLTAKLCSERLPLGEASIYRLTTAAGHNLLLGLPRQPYPLTFQNVSVPKSAAEPSFVSLEVSLTADYPILSLYE